MDGRIIAIGDIHGCSRALATLLEAVDPQAEDVLVLLGDYVDRGPDSRGVLDQLIALDQRCHSYPLLGNHEEILLSVVAEGASPELWLRYGGAATLDSYGFDGDLGVIPEEHIAFLRGCRDYFETESHFFVHANYLAQVPLSRQPAKTTRWTTLREIIPGPHCSGKTAVVGHTSDETGEVFSLGHLICIDTFCYGGGWLTALDVTSGQTWAANEQGQLRLPRN